MLRVVAFIIARILSPLGKAITPPRLAAIRDRLGAAKAAFAPEFELRAFGMSKDVMPDDEDQRQDVAW